MKKIIFIFILTALSIPEYNATAQSAFELLITTPNEDISRRMVENSEGNFVFVGAKYSNYYLPRKSDGYMIEINKKGEIIREKDIILDDSLIAFHDIRINDEGGYYVLGAVGSNDSGYTEMFAFFEFDREFNILKKDYYTIPENRILPGGFLFKNSNNNFIIYGSVRSSLPPAYGVYPLLIEISVSGEFIREKYFIDTDTTYGAMIFDIIEKKDHTGYFASTQDFPKSENNLRGRVLSLDKNFELLSYIHTPEKIYNVGNIKWFTDATYILSGTKNQGLPLKAQKDINAQDNDIALLVLDTLGNIINSKYIGKLDTTDFPGFFFNFDYSADNSSIYVAGTQNFVFYPFPDTKSEIILTKLDRDLNVIWEKFYGGDAYYIVQTVQSTSDGGCIIISSRYDYEKPEYQDDIHILKVDFYGGIIASVENKPVVNVSELIVYPNPGNSDLKIRTAMQRVDGEFYLFDISGKQVLQRQITDIKTIINTIDLKDGIYIYKYIHKNKLVESGKWIKN